MERENKDKERVSVVIMVNEKREFNGMKRKARCEKVSVKTALINQKAKVMVKA